MPPTVRTHQYFLPVGFDTVSQEVSIAALTSISFSLRERLLSVWGILYLVSRGIMRVQTLG